MFQLRRIVYFICFCILLHLILYIFDIDVFELFDKRFDNVENTRSEENESLEIDSTILALKKGIEELKDITSI